jgi:hypothetical protein
VACAVGTLPEGTKDGGGIDASIDAPAGDAKPGEAGTTCNAPKTTCAEAGCVDTTSDPNHCGACGTSCETADASGLVASSNDNPDSGIPGYGVDAGVPWSVGAATCATSKCGVQCPQGLTQCADGVCYDTENFHEHCGSCSTACTAGQYCGGGHCCTSGTAYCGAACIDVLGDSANCGGCGKACTSGMSCVGGVCVACSNSNYAPSATASTSSGGVGAYGPANANDGVLETNGQCSAYNWVSTYTGSTTEWIQLAWTTTHTITKVHVDTTASTNDACGLSAQTLTGAQVQWWNGSAWVTDGTVSGQTNDWDYTFTQKVTTTKIRLYSLQSKAGDNAFIFELQAFGCN